MVDDCCDDGDEIMFMPSSHHSGLSDEGSEPAVYRQSVDEQNKTKQNKTPFPLQGLASAKSLVFDVVV